MRECAFCEEEFENEEALHIHWLEEHEDELNSHQKDKAKKAKREREEREKVRKERRKRYVYQGVGVAVLIGVAALIVPQLMPSGNAEITLEGEPMIGEPEANVTVVEFGDFQCPACNSFEQSTYSQLKTEYIDTGQVKFYWKDYPLEQIHPWARTASETMECVYRQNETAFWNVKSTLFDNQATLNTGNAESRIISWAEEEGVNSSEVQTCVNSGDAGREVNGDIREGQQNGVTGTPSIYVNGEKLSDFSYPTLKQKIESELGN